MIILVGMIGIAFAPETAIKPEIPAILSVGDNYYFGEKIVRMPNDMVIVSKTIHKPSWQKDKTYLTVEAEIKYSKGDISFKGTGDWQRYQKGSFIFNISDDRLFIFDSREQPRLTLTYSTEWRSCNRTVGINRTTLVDRCYYNYRPVTPLILSGLRLNTFDSKTAVLDPEVDACGSLDASGEYILNTSLTSDPNANCIEINSNDVVLDCDGYSITGDQSIGFAGIWVWFQISNITVHDCNTRNSSAGIFLFGTFGPVNITNNNMSDLETGIGGFGTDGDINITNNNIDVLGPDNNAVDVEAGIGLGECVGNYNISNNNIYVNDSDYGIYYSCFVNTKSYLDYNNVTNIAADCQGGMWIFYGSATVGATANNNKIYMSNSSYNTACAGLHIENYANETWENNYINYTWNWLRLKEETSNNTFTNTTFATTPYGQINYYGSIIPDNGDDITVAILRIEYNNAWADGATETYLDTFAQIDIGNLTDRLNATPLINYTDGYDYIVCDDPDCIGVSFINDTYKFNVSGFSRYSTNASWNISCSENTILSRNYTSFGNISIIGEGSFNFNGYNITNTTNRLIQGINSTATCNVYCRNNGCFRE